MMGRTQGPFSLKLGRNPGSVAYFEKQIGSCKNTPLKKASVRFSADPT